MTIMGTSCPFCGNTDLKVDYNREVGISFILCGDGLGKGGCGAVVSFKPRVSGLAAVSAYKRRLKVSEPSEATPKQDGHYNYLLEDGE